MQLDKGGEPPVASPCAAAGGLGKPSRFRTFGDAPMTANDNAPRISGRSGSYARSVLLGKSERICRRSVQRACYCAFIAGTSWHCKG
jgi:hypothetical protein